MQMLKEMKVQLMGKLKQPMILQMKLKVLKLQMKTELHLQKMNRNHFHQDQRALWKMFAG